jgi:hypothetical protein
METMAHSLKEDELLELENMMFSQLQQLRLLSSGM